MAELPDFADLLVELLEANVRFLLVGGYAVRPGPRARCFQWEITRSRSLGAPIF